MDNINQPIGNYTSCMKNFTPNSLFGITNNNTPFELKPEGYMMADYIYVVSHCKQDLNFMMMTPLETRFYPSPKDARPAYIEELNCVLFATSEDRLKALEKYGDGSKLVKSYAAGTIPLINGSYVVVTCLNSDKQYYTITGRTITPLPKEKPEYINECVRKYNIDKAEFDIYDIFVINQIIRDGDGQNKNTIVHSEIKRIERSKLHPGEPIVFNNNGFVAFDSKLSAESFIEKYNSVSQYMVAKALETTHAIHAQEISDLNDRAQTDKRGIVEVFGLMGGTSVVSILAENVIKSSMDGESSEETFKKALKIFAVGAIGVGGVFALYKLYKKYSNKKKTPPKN